MNENNWKPIETMGRLMTHIEKAMKTMEKQMKTTEQRMKTVEKTNEH